jgi:hypothetical protein
MHTAFTFSHHLTGEGSVTPCVPKTGQHHFVENVSLPRCLGGDTSWYASNPVGRRMRLKALIWRKFATIWQKDAPHGEIGSKPPRLI